MKKIFLVFVVSFCFGLIGVMSLTSQAYAKPPSCEPVAQNLAMCSNNLLACNTSLGTCNGDLSTCDASLTTCSTDLATSNASLTTCSTDLATCDASLTTCTGNLTTCNNDLGTCNTDLGQAQTDLAVCTGDLNTCTDDLAACEATPCQIFPGDGYAVSGSGPPLSYTDNGDGTFTDNNTKLMWEKKDDASGIHDKDNTYTWSATGSSPDGTLFTVFLDALNNTCNGSGATPCTTDADCVGMCGFVGHQDWRIPNLKELESIVDSSKILTASSYPGLTLISPEYWSATLDIGGGGGTAWKVTFTNGGVNTDSKLNGKAGRAVLRP